jgi:AhpC/TSA family protein
VHPIRVDALTPENIANIREWTAAGGRWYVADWSNGWLQMVFPEYQDLANWDGSEGSADNGSYDSLYHPRDRVPGTAAAAPGMSARDRIVWALLGLAACGTEPESAAAPVVGEPIAVAAPASVGSRVRTTDGNAIDPLADAEHDVVVLLFVTPDCPVSNRYAPELQRIAATTPAARVAWWLVYPDPDVDAAEIAAHREAYGLPWPALHDPEHELVARAQAIVTPEAAVFVRDGAGGRSLAYHGRIDDRVPEFGRARPEPTVRDLVDALGAVLAGTAVPHASAKAVGCPIGDLR